MHKTLRYGILPFFLLVVIIEIVLLVARVKTDTIIPSSPVSGVEAGADVSATTTILFFGDMMFDRSIRTLIADKGFDFIFENVRELFCGSDAVVANLEGVFSEYPSVAKPGKLPLRFTFDRAWADSLGQLGVTAVSQANNHALDFGPIGLAQSRATLETSGIGWFGDPTNENPAPLTFVSENENVTLIGYHEFAYAHEEKVLDTIRQSKATGAFVVVFPHWGVEYERMPSTLQKRLGHAFIDAGADAVIGAHPHVVQTLEVYNDRPIFYSLGNFVFDQWFSADVMRGLGVRLVLSEGEASYELLPIFIERGQPRLAVSGDRTAMLDFLATSQLTGDMRSDVLSGRIIVPRYGTTTASYR